MGKNQKVKYDFIFLSNLYREKFNKFYGEDPSKWGAFATTSLRDYPTEEARDRAYEMIMKTDYPSLSEKYHNGFLNIEAFKKDKGEEKNG